MGQLSLSDSAALHLWIQVAALFVLARVFGTLARRVGQPEVIGFLIGGFLLGPSILGAIWPAAQAFMLPSGGESQLLGAVAQFCLLMVLIVLGAETDLPLIRRLGRAAAGVSIGSIVLPLIVGSAVAYAVAAPLVPGNRLAGAILIGGALSVSSLPIIARLVVELGVVRRNFGQLAVAAAAVNDVYGFLLIVVVAALAHAGGVSSIALSIGGLAVLFIVFVVAGQRTVDVLLARVRSAGPNPTGAVAVAVAVALVAAAAMRAFGIEAALGAFIAGILVGRSRFQHGEALGQLESFSTSVFAPLYFASAGLQVDLGAIGSASGVVALVALLAAAVLSKAAGTALGARYAGLERREIGALSVLLNGRGAMQVIIGTAGLRMDLLSPAGYTILVAVSIGSSVLVSPALRRLVGNWPGSREEQRRLAHEERLRNSVLVRGQRLLVPTAVSPRPDLAAALLDRAWPPEAELTVLSAPGRDGQVRVGPLKRPIRERTSLPGDPLAGLLAEANLGYGIIGLGLASSVPVDGPGARGSVGGAERSGDLVGLLNATPLPILIVRAGTAAPASGLPARRVAIAVTGTAASLAAEELAIGLCAREGESLHIVHVVPTAGGAASGDRDGDNEGDGEDAADRVLVAARERAARAGVEARVERRTAATASAGLADYARDVDIDLLVVGTRLRRVGNAPFLGHTVEGLLREVTVTSLAIVALPETATTEDQPYTARRHA